jgi:hypothetical protein
MLKPPASRDGCQQIPYSVSLSTNADDLTGPDWARWGNWGLLSYSGTTAPLRRNAIDLLRGPGVPPGSPPQTRAFALSVNPSSQPLHPRFSGSKLQRHSYLRAASRPWREPGNPQAAPPGPCGSPDSAQQLPRPSCHCGTRPAQGDVPSRIRRRSFHRGAGQLQGFSGTPPAQVGINIQEPRQRIHPLDGSGMIGAAM